MKYPNPCSRCGFCCIAETCIAGQAFYGVAKQSPCPALTFDRDIAKCELVEYGFVPTGDGCCIKARCYDRDGEQHDFASLTAQTKKEIVYHINYEKKVRGAK